jgi:hypothetical protein
MKQFEAFLGTEFKAWAVSENVKIGFDEYESQVQITQTLPDGRIAKTYFNLGQLPAYSVVE